MASDRAAMVRALRESAAIDVEPPRPDALVRVDGVTRRFKSLTVLEDVTLQAGAGECLALLGHNGAGKTTLFKLMLGLIRPHGGSVRVDGHDPTGKAFGALKRQIGFLPESIAFHDAMTGEQTLAFYARLKGVPRADCPALLERVGLGEAARRRVRTYSKGMRQRLGLAQALLGAPRLLLLDEPTTGMDPALRHKFFEQIRGLQRSGVTIIISSHALGEIEAIADRVAILRRGRVVAEGTLGELKRTAGLPVQVRLTFARGRAEAVRRRLEGRYEIADAGVDSLTLACPERDKSALLREVAVLDPPAEDIDIRSPGLDAVYAHFTDAEHGR